MICGPLVARIEYNYVRIRMDGDTTRQWQTCIVQCPRTEQ